MKTFINTTSQKPTYLLSKEEIIQERDRMESNWNDSMTERMRDLCSVAYTMFHVPLSQLN